VANGRFYDAFYREFNKRYARWEDLPESWRASKKIVADFIGQQTRDGDRLLSIGCGNGYVEFLLAQRVRRVVAIEPSAHATRMLRADSDVRVYEGFFPQALPAGEESFALAYMVATEYVFDNHALRQFLSRVRESRTRSFLLISASARPFSPLQSARQVGKVLLARLNLRPLGQFWGYERTPAELVRLFRQAGYSRISTGQLGYYVWVRGDLS
jgi:SAM-dependent methyltransferase